MLLKVVFTFLLSSNKNLLNVLANLEDGCSHIGDLSTEAKALDEDSNNLEVHLLS